VILAGNLSVQDSDITIAMFSDVSYKVHVTLLEMGLQRMVLKNYLVVLD
jgi:hypothetical protein